MKTLIIILIIASFLQTTIISLDLVLIILICRSYVSVFKSNLYLAFFFGLLISYLNLETLGVVSLIYLLIAQVTESLSKIRLAGNSLLIIPITLGLLSLSHILNSIFIQESLQLFPKVFIESLISLPILYMVRRWEERFIVRKDIKLKV